MEKKADIIFTQMSGAAGDLGIITLNRPEVLNALNHSMFLELDRQLKEWENAKLIKAVVIRAAEGRAFCAGGDIRNAYERGRARDPQLPKFFGDEYRMNRRIYHFPKPYIALLDGITMGGGAGISLHGSHRVATPRLQFAMPETGIGFYPDVGMSFVLTRLPTKMGFYLGLNGARIPYNDCLALGLVDCVVESDALPKIIEKLAASPLQHDSAVNDILNYFSIPAEHSELMDHQVEIETCFAKKTMEKIFQTLENYPTAWCEQKAAELLTKSPTSLKVTLRLLQKAKSLSLDECLDLDYNLTCHFIRGHDFYEGVRAVIIDKDQRPAWRPKTLAEVSAAEVDNYFMPLPTTG